LATHTRVLLIEHLDANGAAPIDARHHAAALRSAGLCVDALIVEGERGSDLLFPASGRRTSAGFEVLSSRDGALLAERVAAAHAEVVLWASASRGGGELARTLPGKPTPLWWPTGLAAGGAASGPLPALDAALAPIEGALLADDSLDRRRLSLWDGPFALMPALPARRDAATLLEAFADASEASAEIDLVVLAHPEPGFEQLARRAGVGQRVHFVGPAPREAEHAWLGTASALLACVEQPLSGGLVLRSLDAGCPVLPFGSGGIPLERWLQPRGLIWAPEGASLADALAAAVRREPAVLATRARGREEASRHGMRELGARVAAALRASRPPERRAA
jgi:hypothetical protein